MASKEVTGPQSRVFWSDDGYVRCDLAEGAEVTGQDALEQLAAITHVMAHSPAPVLVDLRRTRSVSREARTTFASYEGTSRLALYVESSLSRVIANFFVGVARPSVPTKVFTEMDDALRWLLDHE